MSLLDDFLPQAPLRQIDRIAVAADPARTWSVVRNIDLYRIGFVRRLFALRAVPERLLATVRGKPSPMPKTSRIDEFTAQPGGFMILDEQAPHEIAIGAIGKFWQPKIHFADVAPGGFHAFNEPGFGKVAWSLRVEPRDGGGSWVIVDLRVDATDEVSRAKFRAYWLLIGRFSHAIRRGLLRTLREELGEALSEDARTLPGDDLLPVATFQRTDAITIDAPPSRVFPWLVQMGCQRAGWYSYDRLDNAGIHSAETLEPALQRIAVGDILPARPTGDDGFAVLRVEEPHVLVLGAPSLLGDGRPPPAKPEPYLGTWAFVLEPIGDDATRLLVRVRAEVSRGVYPALLKVLIAPVHRFMEAQQLRNLKRRAEKTVSP